MEKLPDRAVNPEKVQLNAGARNLTFGGNAVRFTGLLLWWLPNLENSTACFKSMPFLGMNLFWFVSCFFPLIDGSCDACFVCCGGLLVIGFSVECLDALFGVCLCLFFRWRV